MWLGIRVIHNWANPASVSWNFLLPDRVFRRKTAHCGIYRPPLGIPRLDPSFAFLVFVGGKVDSRSFNIVALGQDYHQEKNSQVLLPDSGSGWFSSSFSVSFSVSSPVSFLGSGSCWFSGFKLFWARSGKNLSASNRTKHFIPASSYSNTR